VAKLYGYWITVNYREAYQIFASNGILFNHESPLRGETFVTRKITRAVSRIALGLQDKLFVGNLSAQRDWGHAKDYVDAMYRIMQHEKPDDFVVATGVTTEVREFIRRAFNEVGIEIDFKGEGSDEQGYIKSMDEKALKNLAGNDHLEEGQIIVEVDPNYFRPTEVDLLIGDPTKVQDELGWKPKYSLNELIQDMIRSDIKLMQKEKYLKDGGYQIMNYFE
jgi:GDPmannose 4,6-dehydratase